MKCVYIRLVHIIFIYSMSMVWLVGDWNKMDPGDEFVEISSSRLGTKEL